MAENKPVDLYETDNPFQASQKLREHFGYHQLLNSDQSNFYFKEDIAQFDGFSVFEFEFFGDLAIQHYSVEDAYVFHFPVNGHFLINAGQEVVKVSSGQMFILSPNITPHFRMQENVHVFILYVQRKYLLKHARDILQYQPNSDVEFPLTDYPESAVTCIREAMLSVLENSKLFSNQCIKAIYRKQAESYLLTLLLTVIDNSFSPLLQLTETIALPSVIKSARTFMLENIGETIHLDDLCRASKVSKRTLIYQFKKHTGETPMAFLLALRLDRLRENLKQDKPAENILAMAMTLGLNHPGRLAKSYQQRFGELPSQTISALK